MLSQLDSRLVDLGTRFLAFMQDRFDVTPPAVLRETINASLVTYSATFFLMIIDGNIFACIVMLLTLPFMLPTTWRLQKRYMADGHKSWSTELARKYMALALGRRESMRGARETFIILTLLMVAISVASPAATLGLLANLTMEAFWVVSLLHEYLSAAEPGSPGDRIRRTQLQFATQSGHL